MTFAKRRPRGGPGYCLKKTAPCSPPPSNTGAKPCYEAGLVNDKKASHRRPRAFFKARGLRSLSPPEASLAGSGGANPRLVRSACELGGVGVTLGLGDVLRQNSQDLSPAAQPAIQGGGVQPSF